MRSGSAGAAAPRRLIMDVGVGGPGLASNVFLDLYNECRDEVHLFFDDHSPSPAHLALTTAGSPIRQLGDMSSHFLALMTTLARAFM
jgi:hypothetical protein